MKMLVVMWSMYIGGTTKSLIPFLKLVQRKGIDVELYLIDKREESLSYVPKEIKIADIPELDEVVCMPYGLIGKLKWMLERRIIHIALQQKFVRIFPKKNGQKQREAVSRLYQKRDYTTCLNNRIKVDLLDRYDVVMSWGEYLPNYAIANNVICKRKYGWIHPDYITGGFDAKIDKIALDDLDGIVAVSNAGGKSLESSFPEWKERIYVVPNVMDIDGLRVLAREGQTEICTNTFKIVTVARIQNISKAFDRAVRIVEKLKHNGLKFCWYIIGDGEDRESVNKQIVEKGLQDYMKLLGARENPYPYMAAADLFVLQSYYEGRPLVVDEALVIGTPALVTNYVSAYEQVNSNVGMVVENEEDKIVEAIEDILNNQEKVQDWKENLKNFNFSYLSECPSFFEMIDYR